jgi:hypothetical protein
MSDFSAIDFLGYKRTHIPAPKRAATETVKVVLDECEEAFLRKDWPRFDRWFRAYRYLRRSDLRASTR